MAVSSALIAWDVKSKKRVGAWLSNPEAAQKVDGDLVTLHSPHPVAW